MQTWLTFSQQSLLKIFHAGSAQKKSGKVWLICSRISGRVRGVDENFSGKVLQKNFNQGLLKNPVHVWISTR